jgi:hypothetical protein
MHRDYEHIVRTTFGELQQHAEEIKVFVCEEVGENSSKLRFSTAINNDLFCDGWDAWDLLDHF